MYLSLRRAVTVQVQRGTDPPFNVTCDEYDTVFSLKESIAAVCGLNPINQRLVFAGKVLSDQLSLSFYNISDGSRVFLVPHFPRKEKPRPYQMLNRLLSLVEELPTADSDRYMDVTAEIDAIIEEPFVRGVARIDPDVQQLLEGAEDALYLSRRPVSRRTRDFVARSHDIIMDQFDACPEGLRIMKGIIDAEDDDDDSEPIPTELNYRSKINDRPLPNPWSRDRLGIGRRSILKDSALRMSMPIPRKELSAARKVTFEGRTNTQLKSKFSQQLAALKNMGFNDEKVILEALSETNGNVQLAAKLLRDNFFV